MPICMGLLHLGRTMKTETERCSTERKELERDPSGFKFLAPNGIYQIDENFRAPLQVQSSYARAKAFSAGQGKKA